MTQVFVSSLKYVKYGKFPIIVCKVTCELLTHHIFVFNWHFACLFAFSVALGFQISLLVACFLDICRLWKYSTNTTISFLQNSRLFFWKKLAIPPPAEKNPGCSTGFECLISHWLTWRSVRTVDGRSVGRTHDVITKPKFLALMGLPKSLSYGAPRARPNITTELMVGLDFLKRIFDSNFSKGR